jgi:hypothetical protein
MDGESSQQSRDELPRRAHRAALGVGAVWAFTRDRVMCQTRRPDHAGVAPRIAAYTKKRPLGCVTVSARSPRRAPCIVHTTVRVIPIVLILAAAALVVGCGGGSAITPTGSDASAPLAMDAGQVDEGNSAACPSTTPRQGSSCTLDQLECAYGQNIACSGYWVCASGSWRREFPGEACSMSSSPMGDSGLLGDSGPAGDSSSTADAIPEGGSCHGTSGVVHRAQAITCESHAGFDAGCQIQPHDECLADGDCGTGKVCLCESLPAPGQPCAAGVPRPTGNICIPANCRVDSDCSPCGVCQAQYWCGEYTGYYCQTPGDACFPTTTSYDGNGCNFSSGQWLSSVPAVGGCPG